VFEKYFTERISGNLSAEKEMGINKLVRRFV
jgi:hypothetical protein